MKFNKFTFGIALGTVVGLLIAPEKGSTTRKRLSETATALKLRLEELFGKGESDLDELKSMLEDKGTELDTELRYKLVKLVERSKKAYEQAKKESIE